MGTLDGIRSIDDLRLENLRVLIRVDFDVPLSPTGEVANDARIRAALPTIKKALSVGARVVLAAHLGQPNGKANSAFSLEPAALRLSELLDLDVFLPDDCISDAARKLVSDARPGQVVMLENLRFHAEEEKNEENFARELAALCDVYVNDAFGASHRAHASVVGLPRLIRDRGMGYALRDEVLALSRISEASEKPFVGILGGANIPGKLKLIEALFKKCEVVCIGGAMGNTFLAAAGNNLQSSFLERDQLPLARTLLEQARDRGVRVVLPSDVVVAAAPDATEGEVVAVRSIPERQRALDIGPNSLKTFTDAIAKAKLVLWSGPLGSCESPAFSEGSWGIARALADSPAFGVVLGQDTSAIAQAAGPSVADRIGFISTGGRAPLELIEGLKLPGIEALRGN